MTGNDLGLVLDNVVGLIEGDDPGLTRVDGTVQANDLSWVHITFGIFTGSHAACGSAFHFVHRWRYWQQEGVFIFLRAARVSGADGGFDFLTIAGDKGDVHAAVAVEVSVPGPA